MRTCAPPRTDDQSQPLRNHTQHRHDRSRYPATADRRQRPVRPRSRHRRSIGPIRPRQPGHRADVMEPRRRIVVPPEDIVAGAVHRQFPLVRRGRPHSRNPARRDRAHSSTGLATATKAQRIPAGIKKPADDDRANPYWMLRVPKTTVRPPRSPERTRGSKRDPQPATWSAPCHRRRWGPSVRPES